MAVRDAVVPTPVSSPPAPALHEGSASNMSSPLSDVEDKDGDSDIMDLELMRKNPGGDYGAQGDTSTSLDHEESGPDDGDHDDDSNLSDVDINDSEAETERLYDSPAKRKASRNGSPVRVDHGCDFQASPSKLNQQTRAAARGRGGGSGNGTGSSSEKDQSDSESSATPAARKPVREVPVAKTPPKSRDVRRRGSQSSDRGNDPLDSNKNSTSDTRKRKRSPATGCVEADQPVRKRIGSVPIATDGVDETTTIASTADDADATPMDIQSGEHSEDEVVPSGRASKREAVSPTRSKRSVARKEKQTRGGDVGDPNGADNPPGSGRVEQGAVPGEDEHAEVDADVDHEEADVDVDNEGDADTSHKDEEELGRRKAAQEFILELEKSFADFRDQYYEERIRLLNEEEAMLTAAEPTHPEYLAMMHSVDSRRDDKLRIVEAEYKLNQESLQRWAVAGRAQIMSQYYQDVRKTREEVLEELGDEWYRIQQQRRFHANNIADFSLRYPDARPKALKQAIAYNKEVSILSGIAKHRGFPGAPEIAGASLAEIEDDLEEISQARRGVHHAGAVAATFQDYGAIPNERILGPAGAEFLKQTPWANPSHPSHQHPRPQSKTPGTAQTNSPALAPHPHRHPHASRRHEHSDHPSIIDGTSRLSPLPHKPGLVVAPEANA
ncbi:hypothetical protein RB597_008707 [Gaeumannomyces tritici]